MRVSFYTLGCKVNQNESNAMLEDFCRHGYLPAEEGEGADVYVVNSCTVTANGDQKSRKWLRRMKREHPGAVTVLTGCYPQAFPQEAAGLAEADIVTGTTQRRKVYEYVEEFLRTGQRIVAIEDHTRGEAYEELSPVSRFAEHTRAFVKVEDGCNRQCAYCVIPRARGPVRSRPFESVRRELEALAAAGYSEVVLTGINLSSYGKDIDSSLTTLVEQAVGVEGIQRIRLGSLEPDLMKEDDILRLAKVDKFCPQFHLSLQSGCTETLRRMRRVYTAEEYTRVVNRIREVFGPENCSFTTDIIVGFPGETPQEFETTCRFVEEIGFLKVHVFPYSRRRGTPAYDFPGQICERDKSERSRILGQIAEDVRARQAKAMEGQTVQVLLETPLSATMFTGYTPLYLPVVVSAPGHKSGDLVTVTLKEYAEGRCRAEIL